MTEKNKTYIIVIFLTIIITFGFFSWRNAMVVEENLETADSNLFITIVPFFIGLLITTLVTLIILELMKRQRE